MDDLQSFLSLPGAEVSRSRRGDKPELLALVLPNERRHGGTLRWSGTHPHAHRGGRRRGLRAAVADAQKTSPSEPRGNGRVPDGVGDGPAG